MKFSNKSLFTALVSVSLSVSADSQVYAAEEPIVKPVEKQQSYSCPTAPVQEPQFESCDEKIQIDAFEALIAKDCGHSLHWYQHHCRKGDLAQKLKDLDKPGCSFESQAALTAEFDNDDLESDKLEEYTDNKCPIQKVQAKPIYKKESPCNYPDPTFKPEPFDCCSKNEAEFEKLRQQGCGHSLHWYKHHCEKGDLSEKLDGIAAKKNKPFCKYDTSICKAEYVKNDESEATQCNKNKGSNLVDSGSSENSTTNGTASDSSDSSELQSAYSNAQINTVSFTLLALSVAYLF